AWMNSYSPTANQRALDAIANEPVPYKISHMASRLFFRGIYFPKKGAWQWMKLIVQNRRPIFRIIRESFTKWHGTADAVRRQPRAPALSRTPLAASAPPESGAD